MANSSILGGEVPAKRAKGRDVDALGPSDSSDSGSDVQGQSSMPTRADSPDQFGAVPVHRDSDSDAQGTGERASATGDAARDGADILPDRIKRATPRCIQTAHWTTGSVRMNWPMSMWRT